MTCIVNPSLYPTKKSLREAILKGREVWIEDPSIFAPREFNTQQMAVGQVEVVTNHPKRSWFAQIERVGSGGASFKVK